MTVHVKIQKPLGGAIEIGNDLPVVFFLGPCQMESRAHALDVSGRIKEIGETYGVDVVYKTSFDKANRSSIKTPRGLGLDDALPIFDEIRKTTGLPVLTDVHEREQCTRVAEVVDILQIPAYLCRQTDLLLAAGNTGRVVNVKKGQFLAPWDMKNVAEKIASTGNDKILLCERGVSFGYNTLVSDMRSLPIMAQTGYPVVFDATHSVQQPGGKGESSGGQREFVPVLARAAAAVGVAAIFMETHEDPDNAPSDGPNMVKLKDLPALIENLMAFDKLAKSIRA
ncbi:MAG: 3-deoxy-8-phosphooctulonate synthase [Alphaproteobacteria bacterium]|nr:3-deoxy-8-phosphooctulonate synthase [Alphaproteobacteria bacterium]